MESLRRAIGVVLRNLGFSCHWDPKGYYSGSAGIPGIGLMNIAAHLNGDEEVFIELHHAILESCDVQDLTARLEKISKGEEFMVDDKRWINIILKDSSTIMAGARIFVDMDYSTDDQLERGLNEVIRIIKANWPLKRQGR